MRLLVDCESVGERLFCLQITVQDSGIGISEDLKPRLFKAFEQEEGDDAFHSEGTGLGLAIAKRLVEMMDGKLVLDGSYQVGASFQVALPGVSLSEAPMQQFSAPSDLELSFRASQILIADDVPSNRELIRSMLREQPFDFIEASHGEQALELAVKHQPDLILMDIKMPKMNGIDAINMIKKQSIVIPTLALTAFAMPEEHRELELQGFDGVLVKPVNKNELLSLLGSFLGVSTSEKKQVQNQVAAFIETDSVDVSEILQTLEDDWQLRWETLQQSVELSALQDFSDDLKQLVRQCSILQFDVFIQEFDRLLQQFNLIAIPDLMAGFPILLQENIHLLKEHLKL